MDYQNVAQKILQIHSSPHGGFDDTDFMEKLEEFLQKKMEIFLPNGKERFSFISEFIWEEKFGRVKFTISDTEQDYSYYKEKWQEINNNTAAHLDFDQNNTESSPVDIIIGGEKDILLYELLSRFDQLREGLEEAVYDTEEESEAAKLIESTLRDYETILVQVAGTKEVLFEAQNLINTYITEYEQEVREKTRENTLPRQELPEAKIIKPPTSFWKNWKK